ncbi:uncharacterized protein K452DRAFT_299264 [Aplosporella prunicola CBS 121167]|uniref:F-box domain-containing protein n=1 Tax=Aplosporella prunicola CBS 121167 TaxID=1176127 RepID=A0A6A6B8G8_9PEZI|nr:uncharacterized protein K452DRAFT_299264 [Aplosporella prunicola CBS 121167]KAF2140512.1 hypothetical protein K452DRAFT_299264 [Aplosporella prunicola CBS 121167]
MASERHSTRPLPPPQPDNILYTSPVATYQARSLPLNIFALILTYIDDLGDLARITRTSRLCYYMALPRLYDKVTLRSYSELRYTEDGRPEGYGSGSPFSMGLNGLVTKNVAHYVRSLRLVGHWRESDNDDFKKGRVPDNSMMLNIAVRAAMDRMERLEEFQWELNTKPLQTIYSGFLSCPTLKSLTLKFPATRIPRPTVMIPPLPNLREFKALDMDPLCYPDDISMLLLHSKKLESLHLHWSPRMREAGEESTNLHAYFGRTIAANYRLPLKKFSFINLYTRANVDLESLIDIEGLEEVSFINCNTRDAITVFVDETWRMVEWRHSPKALKMMRGDVLDSKQAGVMATLKGLERLYLVNARSRSDRTTPPCNSVSINTNAFDTRTPPNSGSTPSTPMTREHASIAGDYLAAITRQVGPSLRHLLLSDQWVLEPAVLMTLARACPNLEQLGIAVAVHDLEALHQALRVLPRLFALRILLTRLKAEAIELMQSVADELHQQVLGYELRHAPWDHVRWLGVGDMSFELGGTHVVPLDAAAAAGSNGPQGRGQGDELAVRRIVTRVEPEAVRDIEIWKMDSFEVY